MGISILRTVIIAGVCCASSQAIAADEPAMDEGQIAYNNHCRTCHSTDVGDNRLGPDLKGVIGRKAGAASGFGYSSAFRGAEFEWTEDKLDQFIADPDSVVPGNKMKPFAGVADEKVRGAIVSYLKTQ